jgi:hypothetical protein
MGLGECLLAMVLGAQRLQRTAEAAAGRDVDDVIDMAGWPPTDDTVGVVG